jgi:twinkle protein
MEYADKDGWHDRLPCPNIDCQSSDAFSYNENSGAGKCFSCSKKYPKEMPKLMDWASDEYPTHSTGSWEGTRKVQVVEKQDNVTEFLTPTFRGVRDITDTTMKFYGVKTYVNSNNDPVKQEYVYPSGGVKTRYFPKEFRARNLKSDELFGMNLWNSGSCKIVTITEGELDAMSAYQMCNNPKFPAAFVSLPSSTPSHRLWANVDKWLSSFDKIVLSIEHDDAGNAVAQRIANLYPNKVYRVQHDKYKDANEFLQAGARAEFFNAWFNAVKYTPENIYNTTDKFLNLYNGAENHVYVETGIQDFDALCMGLMQGHFTLFKAQTGIGKTEFMRYLEYHILKNYPNISIAAWHMEETKLRSLLGLVSYELKDNVTRKDLIAEKGRDADVQEAIKTLTKDERFYQFFLNDEDDPLDILQHIRYLSQACGVKYVFFEPIQDIAANMGAEESKEQFLADLSVRLSKLAAELGVGIVTIGHTNDDGAVKYCRMIEQRASVVVELNRNKLSENADERNTTKLLVTKNRPVGPTGYAGQLVFNTNTFTLAEKYGDI